MDKSANSFKSTVKYRVGGHFKEKQSLSLASQKIMVDDKGDGFQVKFTDIFADYQNLTLTGDINIGNKAWCSWQHTPMDWWQCQLNFAVWCTTAGCGVSADDHLQAKDPLLASLYRFHVYYATRHLLVELKVALPGDQSHSWYQNTYDARAYKWLCTEFGVSPDTDWRQKLDHGCQGLGSWSTYMEPSGAYRHAHYSDGPFFHPMDAICHNRDISGTWTMFIPDKSEGFMQADVERLNDSIWTFGLSWECRPRHARTFSRPGRGSTLKSSSWPTSKMQLLLQSTSPAASLTIKRRSSMHQALWTSSSG